MATRYTLRQNVIVNHLPVITLFLPKHELAATYMYLILLLSYKTSTRPRVRTDGQHGKA